MSVPHLAALPLPKLNGGIAVTAPQAMSKKLSQVRKQPLPELVPASSSAALRASLIFQ
jgi:hypothetical protein